jgi:peptide/nickel transport system substrate-binding protein
MQIGLIYETLLYYDGNSTEDFQDLLATSWAFNETTLEYRFTIREGVQFHNGNNLTPEDVEYTFERAMCQDRPAGPIWMFYQPLLGEDVWEYEDTTFAAIDAAVEVDGQDVVFTLAGDYWEMPFTQILCGQWSSIVDKEWCIAEGDWDGTEGDVTNHLHPADANLTKLFAKSNGTGPWKLNLWESGIQLKVEKNTNYWTTEAPFDMVITQLVTEWTSRKLALQNGDADLVYVPSTYFDEMDAVGGLNVYVDLPSLSVDAFFFNMNIGAEF